MTKYTKFEAIFRNETLVFTDRDPKFRNRLDVYNYICAERLGKMKSRIFKEGQIMKLLDLLNVIEDDTPIWIYIDHPFPCKKEGLFFGAVQFAAENDSEWEGYRVVLTFPELYEPLGGVVGMSIVVVKEEP